MSSSCVRKTQKKYLDRKSPAFSASDCKGLKKMGNDGKYWISKKGSASIYKWHPMGKSTTTRKAKRSHSKTKKKRKTKSDSNDVTLDELKKMAKRYEVTVSGTKKEIAERIVYLRGYLPSTNKSAITKTHRKKLDTLLSK
tara:strand:+ start:1966 stop:2385 length:420 start_codon:yes stop_codon:yes gene_type:complete